MNYTKADLFINKIVAMLALLAMLFSSVPLALAETVGEVVPPATEEPVPATEDPAPTEDETVVTEEAPAEEPMMMLMRGGGPKPSNPKITICHYAEGQGGKYEQNTVDLEATGPKGHTGHSNDIVPDKDDDGNPSGAAKNWTADGQAIWNNDCVNIGTIIVDKVVVGTTSVPASEFKLYVGQQEVKDNQNKKENEFKPGTYTVSEIAKPGVPAGFTATFGGDCNENGQVTVVAGQTKTCTITNTYRELPPPPAKVATFVASKVVCTNEADLPNWGAGGPDITATTAADWVAAHPGCSLASGWDFEWVLDSETIDPGDTLVGAAGGNWTTFGQTDGSGKTSLTLTAAELEGNTKVWFREVLKPGYITFTHEADSSNGNNVSAEFYCHNDAINYDNYDYVNGIELNKTYNCVAFNVPKEVPVVKYPITGAKWHDTNKNGIWDNEEVGIENWVIVLKDEAGAVIATTTTDENGEYAFSVTAGSYVVSEEQQTNWTQTAPNGNTCSFTFEEGIKPLVIGNICNFGNYYTEPAEPVCKIGGNLLKNGSFEEPVVIGDWGIFNPVANWAISLSDGLEVWRNFYGGASEGEQNVELDGNASTRITQTVTTTPGAVYELRFDFSARPDSDSALHNSVEAFVGTTSLMTVTADGTDIAQNTWTTHSQTFTANGASTDISFEDNGLSDSYGTLLDNAVLCLVREPEPEEPTPSCKVTVISDTTNMVDDEVDTNAVLAWVHPGWVQSLTDSVAEWIWSSYKVEDPMGTTTQTFIKTFTWNGPVSAAVLDIATDNTYVVKLNGVQVAADPTEDNFSSVDTHNVAAEVDQGLNTLEITVTNNAYPTESPEVNPAGLLYNLTITDTQSAECKTGGGDGDGDDLYRISGYVWHDDNANQIWDGREMEGEELMEGESEEDLSGWVVKITNGEGDNRTTETDENGYYYFDVPAGTWTVTEEVQSGWARTTQESHVVVVPGDMSFLETVKSFLLPVAHAAVMISEYGENNFGNDTVSGGGSNGGSRSSGTRVSRGALSNATPAPRVLGEQVSVIPDGSPKTGHGGTSQNFNSLTFGQLLLLTRRNNLIK